MTEDNESEHERQTSYYDLLCEVVEPQQARQVTRMLTRLCHCDENSYPFLQGVLNVTQLRLALTLPEAVVKKLNGPLEKFHSIASSLLETFKHHEITSRARVTKSLDESGWPFGRTYEKGALRFLQNLVRKFEEKASYRTRWLVLGCFTIVAFCFVAQQQKYRAELLRVKLQDFDRDQALQDSAAEKLAVLDRQYNASLEQQSNEIAKEKLHNLEPKSYSLAQQIEKSGRRVKFESGIIAWEIVVTGTRNLPLPKITYDDKFNQIITLYLPDTTGEMALSDTSPNASPKAGLKAK